MNKIKDKKNTSFLPFYRVSLNKEEVKAVTKTVQSGWLTTGYQALEFEKRFASFIGVKYAVAVNSCTAALELALLANGVKTDDEVLVPSFTFVSTVNVIVHLRAKPIFIDIEQDTYNISPADILKKITKKTKAILVVHYAGLPVKLNEINAIAKKYKIPVIEDCAHAAGSKYYGKYIGSHGNTGCFSFYATKNLTTGEGGMLTTNNSKIADFAMRNRLHGISKDAWKRYTKEGSWKYDVLFPGYKCNMSDIQASLGIQQLKNLEENNLKRNMLSRMYDALFQNNTFITVPPTDINSQHSGHLYPILVPAKYRNSFIDYMKEKGVGLSVHFIPIHRFSYYKKNYPVKNGDLSVTNNIGERIVSLPLFPSMTKKEVVMVAKLTNEYFDNLKIDYRKHDKRSQ